MRKSIQENIKGSAWATAGNTRPAFHRNKVHEANKRLCELRAMVYKLDTVCEFMESSKDSSGVAHCRHAIDSVATVVDHLTERTK